MSMCAASNISKIAWKWAGFSGSSTGCVVSSTCSWMISLGSRSTHGVVMRSAFQFLSSRHMMGGSHEMPPSTSTNLSLGNLAKTPSVT